MRALSGAIITMGSLIGLGVSAIGVGVRYQNRTFDPGASPFVRWVQLDTPLMLIIIVLLLTLLTGLATTFLGLAYEHEHLHFHRHRSLSEPIGSRVP